MPRHLPLPRPPRQLLPDTPEWPAALSALADVPSRLRVSGPLPPLADAVAVVGTRYADAEALGFTHELGAALAAAGRTVVSGGAFGIDAAAHEGALSVGGATVVVLPTGFDRMYPARHRPLFSRIARGGGALVTERDDGVTPAPWTFLARNRLIAALGACTVVVQAPARSGALSTAAHAGHLKKPVFAVPYAPWEVRGEGCVRLLLAGARVCTSARDILSLRPSGAGPAAPETPQEEQKRNALDGLDDDCRIVYGLLSRIARHPDALAASASLPVTRVHSALLQLELRGLSRRRDDGSYATK